MNYINASYLFQQQTYQQELYKNAVNEKVTHVLNQIKSESKENIGKMKVAIHDSLEDKMLVIKKESIVMQDELNKLKQDFHDELQRLRAANLHLTKELESLRQICHEEKFISRRSVRPYKKK